jgi:hypothetical protein
MDVSELNRKPFTLWLTDENEESAAFSGVARWDGATLFLDRTPGSAFEIRSEWHERIQSVTNEEVRKVLLGADYFLRLYVGELRDGITDDGYEKTGLTWPE